MNIPRVIFFAILLLSCFVTAKSFVATENIDTLSTDLRFFILNDMTLPRGERHPVADYDTKLDGIQKQWAVMRFVGLASCLLSCVGIICVTIGKKRPPNPEG